MIEDRHFTPIHKFLTITGGLLLIVTYRSLFSFYVHRKEGVDPSCQL